MTTMTIEMKQVNSISERGQRSSDLALVAQAERTVASYHDLWVAVEGFVKSRLKKRRAAGISREVCDEVYSESYEAMIRCLDRWKPERGSYTTCFAYELWSLENRVRKAMTPIHVPEWRYSAGGFMPGFDRSEFSMAGLASREDDPRGFVEADCVAREIRGLAEMLPERERIVFLGLHGPGKRRFLRDIGHELGITKERVRQIGESALGHIREMLEESGVACA